MLIVVVALATLGLGGAAIGTALGGVALVLTAAGFRPFDPPPEQ